MKTLSGTLRVVAIVSLGIAAVLSFRAVAQPPPPVDDEMDRLVLNIKKKPNEYRRLKTNSPAAEVEFLGVLCDTQKKFERSKKLKFKSDQGALPEFELPKDCETARAKISSGAQLNIRTDKVTVSNAAKSIAEQELTVIGPHVTQQVASRRATDITAVVNLLVVEE